VSDVTTFDVRRFHDPTAFLDHAGGFLLQAEAENNLILGIAQQLKAGTLLSRKPVYLATIEQDGNIVGCAFRTPPYKLGLTRMPVAAIPSLVKDVAAVYDALPAVMGEESGARAFAKAWAKAHDVDAKTGIVHGIYELDEIIPPRRPANGSARLATDDDIDNITNWIEAFSAEAGVHTDNARALATARMREDSFYLWTDDGAAVSMTAWSGETPNGRRVGYVYTPPSLRGRGYATSLVAHVSERILEDGCRFCFLYTDLSNATSNDIYRQIGYRHLCDVADWHLTPRMDRKLEAK
jgi:GNAT superfamily N-acetyltransferase